MRQDRPEVYLAALIASACMIADAQRGVDTNKIHPNVYAKRAKNLVDAAEELMLEPEDEDELE